MKRETCEIGVAICRPWEVHIAKGNTCDPWHKTTFSYEPVGLLGCGVLDLLLHHDTEDVGNVLVQSTRLPLILQVAVIGRDRMLDKTFSYFLRVWESNGTAKLTVISWPITSIQSVKL